MAGTIRQPGMQALPGRLNAGPGASMGAYLVDSPYGAAAGAAEDDRLRRTAESRAAFDRLHNIFKIAGIGIPAVAGGAALLGAGSGGAASTMPVGYTPGWEGNSQLLFGGAGGTAAPGVGATKALSTSARLGKIFANPGFEVGTNAALALYGQRSQNKANDRARADALANQAKLIEMEEARLKAEAANANLDREDARALNAAIQDLEKKKFALAQEAAQFERGEAEFRRGEYSAEQARLEPYRQISAAAAQRLARMVGVA